MDKNFPEDEIEDLWGDCYSVRSILSCCVGYLFVSFDFVLSP
jgi:hypothetical protein